MLNHTKTSVVIALLGALLIHSHSQAMNFPPNQPPTLSERLISPFYDDTSNTVYTTCLVLGVLLGINGAVRYLAGQEFYTEPYRQWDPQDPLLTFPERMIHGGTYFGKHAAAGAVVGLALGGCTTGILQAYDYLYN